MASEQVQAVSHLLDQEMTVPFISRYRKEITGGLDEVVITSIRDRINQLQELDKRRCSILKSLTKREQLTPDLNEKILAASTLASLEDIYLPYKPKRRTRATMAREKGLEPLAERIFHQICTDPSKEAMTFVDPDKDVFSVEGALKGARDIIAEWINENSEARARIRTLFQNNGVLRSKSVRGKEAEGIKYQDYADWSESLYKAPSHRILAMLRGERVGFLRLHVEPPENEALGLLQSLFVKGRGNASLQTQLATEDCYKRLLAPSMERELLSVAREKADEIAMTVFAENLRQLLLEPPLGQKRILAIDPGFRTGCKVVALDEQGNLIYNDTIYPHPPHKRELAAAQKVRDICMQFEIEVIAVGNGTAGRETEAFLRVLEIPNVPIIMVNESGASIYSASESAREEFPDQDVTVRGAVSIGRRLMDPLAELVKIDPQSIGVGQYQHDVNQAALKRKLEDVVTSCVNSVGVEVNTASKDLLSYVSGLSPKLAESVVQYRDEHGPFRSRENLKKVPRLGPKTFLQAAGFLRIRDGANPLDQSAVHPESYGIVETMARDLGTSVLKLLENEGLQKKVDLNKYVTDKVGLPTLEDIRSELQKSGRDPRQKFEEFQFSPEANRPEDLQPGMKLRGIVTNVTAFGAFVDVGVHQDGLVHISQLADRFVRDLAQVVKVHQKVEVTVLEVDLKRKRISLSMKDKT